MFPDIHRSRIQDLIICSSPCTVPSPSLPLPMLQKHLQATGTAGALVAFHHATEALASASPAFRIANVLYDTLVTILASSTHVPPAIRPFESGFSLHTSLQACLAVSGAYRGRKHTPTETREGCLYARRPSTTSDRLVQY